MSEKGKDSEMHQPLIEVEHLTKCYHGKTILNDLNFRIMQGEKVFVTGESGIGKTTLMRLILGLEKADSGSVRLHTDKISVAFQEDRMLDEFDIIGNIRLISGIPVEELRRDYERILPVDAFYKKLAAYSGGMKRRAAVLRAVIGDASAIFLDEPFKGLDADSRQKTMEYVRERCRDKTLFLITHDLSEAEILHPDKIIDL